MNSIFNCCGRDEFVDVFLPSLICPYLLFLIKTGKWELLPFTVWIRVQIGGKQEEIILFTINHCLNCRDYTERHVLVLVKAFYSFAVPVFSIISQITGFKKQQHRLGICCSWDRETTIANRTCLKPGQQINRWIKLPYVQSIKLNPSI